MNEKLNLVEILKDCPNGMELDCTMFDNVKFIGVENYEKPICIRIGNKGTYFHLTQYGTLDFDENAKCVIYPKDKTTWEGFIPPCKFNDGDIVATNSGLQVFILQRQKSYSEGYCYIGYDFGLNDIFHAGKWQFSRLATEEEKERLFKAINDNGYKWNAETKTLEKLVEPKFKVGDWIISSVLGTAHIIGVNDSNEYQLEDIDSKQKFSSIDYVNYAYDKWTIEDAKDGDVLTTSSGPFIYNGKRGGSSCPGYYCGINTLGRFEPRVCETHWTSKKVYPATKEQRDALMKAMNDAGYKWNAETKTLDKLIKPKFKVGDEIVNGFMKYMGAPGTQHTILKITDDKYIFTDGSRMSISSQDGWDLLSDMLEPKTLDDDKIKTAIRNHLLEMWEHCQKNVYGVHVADAIAWLKKQGESDKNQNSKTISEYLDKEKGCPISLNGEIPTFEVTMKDVRDYNAYKEKKLIEIACKWLREQKEMIGISFQEDFIERFKIEMNKYTN